MLLQWAGGWLCEDCSMDYLKEIKMAKIPPKHIQDKIRSIGTPEQIAALDKQLEQAGRTATGDTKKVTAYFKNLEAPEEMNADNLRGAAQRFFKAKLNRGAKQRPDLCNYKTTRKLLWTGAAILSSRRARST